MTPWFSRTGRSWTSSRWLARRGRWCSSTPSTTKSSAGVPIVIVHISGGEPLEEVRRARARGFTVLAETCPQYLMLTADDLDLPDMEGAKAMCSPPPREGQAQAAMWRGIQDGTVDI